MIYLPVIAGGETRGR